MTHFIRHVEDSYDFIRRLDVEADVTLTDPPYTEHVHANLCSGSLVGKKAVPKYELKYLSRRDPAEWLHRLVTMTRRWSAVFCSVEDFGPFKNTYPQAYVRSCIWYKSNAMGQLTADRPASAYEGIALLHSENTKKRWNGRGSYAVWRCNGTRGKKDRHPNEKPLDLCLKLVALFSEQGETILDPFCGSAAIGEAALRLGRNYVGLDNDPYWCDMARQRLACVSVGSVSDEEALKLCSMRGRDEYAT